MAKDIQARLSALKAKQLAATQKIASLEAKVKSDARKLDTRRKIIVGGLVLAFAEKDPSTAELVRMLVAQNVVRPHDKDALADWLPPEAKSAPVNETEKAMADDGVAAA